MHIDIKTYTHIDIGNHTHIDRWKPSPSDHFIR